MNTNSNFEDGFTGLSWQVAVDSSDEIDALIKKGKTFANRFRLITPLGYGGFGEVWDAKDRLLGNRVALKILKSTKERDLERFIKEVNLFRILPKDRFVSVFDYAVHKSPELAAYSMEKLTNPWIRLDEYRDDYLEDYSVMRRVKISLYLCRDLLSTLSILHKEGYVHRDIKPPNIYVNRQVSRSTLRVDWKHQSPAILKIGDLGIASKVDGTEHCCGTRGWSAPEQFDRSIGKQGPRSDLFAAGNILYYLLIGRSLSEREYGKESAISSSLLNLLHSKYLVDKISEVIAEMTYKNPRFRYEAAQVAIRDIQAIFDSEEDIDLYHAFISSNNQYVRMNEMPDVLFRAFRNRLEWERLSAPRKDWLLKTAKSAYKKGILRKQGICYGL